MAVAIVCPTCQQTWQADNVNQPNFPHCPACQSPRPSLLRYWPAAVAGVATAGVCALTLGLVITVSSHRSTPVSAVAPATPTPAAPVEPTTPVPAIERLYQAPVEVPVAVMAPPVPPAPIEVAPAPKPIVEPPVAPPPVVVAAPEPAKPKLPELNFKRLQAKSPDELTRTLVKAPEINLETQRGTSSFLVTFAEANKNKFPHVAPPLYTERADLRGLPMRMGVDCQINKESAQNLHVLSRKLRLYLGQAAGDPTRNGRAVIADMRPDHTKLRKLLLEGPDGDKGEWTQPDAVPTLVQMLQAESRPLRLLLVDLLDQTVGMAATEGLVQRALFDTAEDVRQAALVALLKRPADDYRAKLVAGLRYPWAPAADHAAEALVALRRTEVVPDLVRLLDRASPNAPETSAKHGNLAVVHEMVRVNHQRNCLLCHSPSTEANELVRGRVFSQSEPLPSSFSPEYYESNLRGSFVRADITYLKQDFAVPQPVANPGLWPAHQRYDYLVRTRFATTAELNTPKPATYPQREAVLFALRELVGQDAGKDAAGWQKLTAERVQ